MPTEKRKCVRLRVSFRFSAATRNPPFLRYQSATTAEIETLCIAWGKTNTSNKKKKRIPHFNRNPRGFS
jgi:hypothetical protein